MSAQYTVSRLECPTLHLMVYQSENVDRTCFVQPRVLLVGFVCGFAWGNLVAICFDLLSEILRSHESPCAKAAGLYGVISDRGYFWQNSNRRHIHDLTQLPCHPIKLPRK